MDHWEKYHQRERRRERYERFVKERIIFWSLTFLLLAAAIIAWT